MMRAITEYFDEALTLGYRCLCLLALLTIIATPRLHAEIIVDEFTQSAMVVEISTPSTFEPVVTEDVGELNATREIGVIALLTVPTASLDSNVGVSSVLSAELNGHTTIRPPQTTGISYTIAYDFAPRDLTQGGVNNAVLFDFISHEGSASTAQFRVIVRGLTSAESYSASVRSFGFNDEPFTVAVPFSDFTLRGGGPTTVDPTRLKLFNVNFFFSDPRENIGWSLKLDRIRIGSIPVPEPLSLQLTTVAFMTFALCARA